MRLPSSLLLLLTSASFAWADVQLPPLFSDHMVLQRELPVPIWGEAAPGESIQVQFAGQTVAAVADAQGNWKVKLAPLQASEESRELVIRGKNTITVQDVVVGDVWLASGQSNMASPLSSGTAAEALPTANDPLLRFFTVVKQVAAEPQRKFQGRWDLSTPEAAKQFSAVAFFFAKELRSSQNVPIAILNASWGGTPIQTWMSLESLSEAPPLTKPLELWNAAYAKHLEVKDKPELMEAYRADMKDWETTVGPAFKAALSAHNEAMSAARAAGQPTTPGPQPSRPEPVPPDPIAMPAASKRPSTPTITYNAMIAPLAPYGIRGALWYQGEADGNRGLEYRALLPRLIEGWRAVWGQGDFAFLIVQLPGCYADSEPVSTKGWAFLREAQGMALKLPKTGMAVTYDIGDPKDVHPDNKIHVGQRLALVGRAVGYGEKLVASGPLFSGATPEGDKIRLKFRETGSGLVIGTAPWVAKNSKPLPEDRLLGFYVAGEDRKWVEAEAKIEGETVIVGHPSVSKPMAVRYAWASFPRANLYNREGLPAAPFRTDEW